MDMKEICIKWQGVFSQADIAKMDGSDIFQFYGWHPAYGEGALLYIGSTRDVKEGITEHGYLNPKKVPSFFRPEEIEIRLGDIDNKHGLHLKTIEGMLVSVHTPAWNSDNIHHIKWAKFDVTIHNTGKRGSLLEKVTLYSSDKQRPRRIIAGEPSSCRGRRTPPLPR